ncbi:MAG: RNA polymerase sigma factor [Sphingosinicella sp.]|nr:RNA polymerase sigma factor [Sphingosinicella sp.]
MTQRIIETVWRMESARIIAATARTLRDIGLAEEVAQDVLLAALQQWPESGVPDNPGAWLTAAAKNRAIDHLRRQARIAGKHEEIARDLETDQKMITPTIEERIDEDVGDDLLRLIFISCHPILPREARVALTLRLLGGLTTQEIARAFLLPDATVGQRIFRAKKMLADAGAAFEMPSREDRTERLTSVLEILYLVFNEGYSATAGDSWMRPQLCDEAMRLGRILAELVPDEPEVHGLVALMELQASRFAARVGPTGEPIRLQDQDRARWDQILLRRGLAALARAEAIESPEGSYQLQAALAACHARARTASETDWALIATLYGRLAKLIDSSVIELNRAVAISMAEGPQAALELIDRIGADPALARYHLLPSVRGDLLEKLGRGLEARLEFERAAAMTHNERERGLLLARAAEVDAAAAKLSQ